MKNKTTLVNYKETAKDVINKYLEYILGHMEAFKANELDIDLERIEKEQPKVLEIEEVKNNIKRINTLFNDVFSLTRKFKKDEFIEKIEAAKSKKGINKILEDFEKLTHSLIACLEFFTYSLYNITSDFGCFPEVYIFDPVLIQDFILAEKTTLEEITSDSYSYHYEELHKDDEDSADRYEKRCEFLEETLLKNGYVVQLRKMNMLDK